MSAKDKLIKMIGEEFNAMIKEAKDNAPDIAKKLEEMRKKLEPDMPRYESLGEFDGDKVRKQKRVQLKTVSEILEIPVNELVLHFLNCVKTNNERSLVEYHLGYITFYSSL